MNPADRPLPGQGVLSPGRFLASRLGLFVSVLVLAVLLLEGGASVFTGRSLFRSRPLASPMGRSVKLGTDLERRSAALASAGEMRGHVDPLVGIMLRPGQGQPRLNATASIEPGGARSRPVPLPDKVAQRIVILGDSVAFGQGVNDDETLAHQLELLLAQVRGPDILPVVATTVAVPGWNHRNAVHFLIDHLRSLDPDIVVFLPVANDLTDTFGVTEGGHRALLPDPAEPDPWLSVHDEPLLAYIEHSVTAAQARGVTLDLGEDAAGPHVLLADLSAESQRRYDDAAGSIELLHRILERVDARLLLAYPEEDAYGWTLRARLLERAAEVPSMSLYTSIPSAYRLVGDSHPSALGLSFMARWVAEDLLQRGWVDGGAERPLPPLPAGAAQHHATELEPAQVRQRARQAASVARGILQPTIDLGQGLGLHQIYGGLNPDGTMSSALAAVLAPGASVELTLAPLVDLPQLYPLQVVVSLDGVVVGELTVPAVGQCREVFSRPAGVDAGAPVEVKLSPELWGVTQAFGRSQVASCRLLSLASSR